MLNEILKQLNNTLEELEAFVTTEKKTKEGLEYDISVLKKNINRCGEDIQRAARVKGKISKLVS